MTATPLGPGREFDAIREMQRRWGAAAQGLGDDCAVLDVPAGERLCVSTDSSVEDVHFRRGWLAPAEIGYRAAIAALSDLAAMAARPLGMLVAITVPPRWREALYEIADGVGDAARATGAPILGGDTTAGETLAITVTVLGAARAPLLRSGARAGHRVYVTGALGGPAAALRALLRGEAPRAGDRARFARPTARIEEALWLAAHGAAAAVDVSDGLLADAAHLAAASGVRVVLDLDRLPTVPGADVRDAAGSGEEYELVVTSPVPLDDTAFEAALGTRLTEIGLVRAAEGDAGRVEARLGGVRVDLPAGYDHFSP